MSLFGINDSPKVRQKCTEIQTADEFDHVQYSHRRNRTRKFFFPKPDFLLSPSAFIVVVATNTKVTIWMYIQSKRLIKMCVCVFMCLCVYG